MAGIKTFFFGGNDEPLIGDLTGDVSGAIEGDVVGDVTGDVTGNADTSTQVHDNNDSDNPLNLWTGTQTEYNSLSSYPTTTLYFVTS